MANPPAVDADNSSAGGASVSASNDDHPIPRGHAMPFSYHELAKVTNNFDPTLLSEKIVAVKKRDDLSNQGDRQILHEIIMLAILRHPNIIKLIGFGAGRVHGIKRRQCLLVYEFMPLRSLHKHLHSLQEDSESLDWETRMAIALGIARGLNYLHNEDTPPVIFNDLKTANILLDQSFNPKLSNFWAAEFTPTHEEYNATAVKSDDVHAYGSVLLELITGFTVNEITRDLPPDQKLFDWLHPMKRDRDRLYEVVDPRLEEGQYERRSLCRAADVALICIDEDPLVRPHMHDVVRAMNLVASEAQRQADHL